MEYLQACVYYNPYTATRLTLVSMSIQPKQLLCTWTDELEALLVSTLVLSAFARTYYLAVCVGCFKPFLLSYYSGMIQSLIWRVFVKLLKYAEVAVNDSKVNQIQTVTACVRRLSCWCWNLLIFLTGKDVILTSNDECGNVLSTIDTISILSNFTVCSILVKEVRISETDGNLIFHVYLSNSCGGVIKHLCYYLLPGKRITVIVWSAPVVQPRHGHCYWTLKRICVLWISWSKRHWSGIMHYCVLCWLRSIVWFVCMFCIVCFLPRNAL